MTYDEALSYVASLEPRGWRLGLDRMQAFVDSAGLLKTGTNFIHVAGTNGKGSVTAFLQSMMVEQGFRTGAFFSPYVVDPRERVQFGREMISKEEFTEVVEYLQPIAERFTKSKYGGITEFEFKTAVGFEFWRRKQCEWVALEVGLGGRLDATNVVHPRCAVIVSIGMDHTHILGETLTLIAFEKAGIIKPKVPVVVGQMASEPLGVILRVAESQEAPVWQVGREVLYEVEGESVKVTTPKGELVVRPSLAGSIQAHNAAVAVAAMQLAVEDVRNDALQRGTERAYVPGRFQVLYLAGKRVVLDGAHNADAAAVLRKTLQETAPGRYAAVVGMTAGHDPKGFLREIKDVVTTIHAAPIDFHRSQSPDVIAQSAENLGLHAISHPTLASALDDAIAEGPEVLVTGSFYLVGEALRSTLAEVP